MTFAIIHGNISTNCQENKLNHKHKNKNKLLQMKASFRWMLSALLVLISAARVATAQSVAVDSIVNVTTTSFDVWGHYDFTPDSTGATYFRVADNPGMIGAISSATLVHFDTTGTWVASFSGLNPASEYWVEPNGITMAFEFFTGSVVTVTTDTLFLWPSVSIDSLSGISTTSVTVNNTVNTGNDTLHVKVTTSTNASFTAGLTWVDIQVPNGTTIAPVTVSGLLPNTDYWVKTEVTNRTGTFVCGSILPFTTLDAGVSVMPSSDSSIVTDTSVTMYGSSNFADSYYFIWSSDYISIEVLKVGSVEGYTVWGGGAVTSASATFSSDPSTVNYWRFVVQHDGATHYGNTMTATTLPIDTPVLSLSIPIVTDTNATAIMFYSSIYSDTMFITYGQPTIGIGTQSTNPVYVSAGTGTLNETLYNLIPGTNGEAQLHAIVHGVDVMSPIVSFVTSPSGAVVAFSGYVTSATVDPSFTMETIHFAFISENDLATAWVDIADSSDAGFIYPYSGGLPYTFQSYGGTAYDTIPVSSTLEINHSYRCRISGYNSANATLFTSGSYFFNTYVPVGVEVVSDLANQMSLVFNDQFSVNFSEAKIVQIYNLSGVKVFESEVHSSISHFNLDQPTGMYLCRTVNATGNISPAKKVILVH